MSDDEVDPALSPPGLLRENHELTLLRERGASRPGTPSRPRSPMDPEVDRYLTLLRAMISAQGYTQLELQDALDWGRSYISQLLGGSKPLRFDQVYSILRVIDVDPREFFGQLYGSPAYRQPQLASAPPTRETDRVASRAEVRELRVMLLSFASLLVDKGLVNAGELRTAFEADSRNAEPRSPV